MLYTLLLDREPWFSKAFFSECLKREDQYLAMARKSRGGDPVGLIAWTVWPEGFCVGQRICFIQDLVVVPQDRKQGIGGVMLDHVKNWALGQGIRVAHLQTSKDENLNFFRENGFEPCNQGLYQAWRRT